MPLLGFIGLPPELEPTGGTDPACSAELDATLGCTLLVTGLTQLEWMSSISHATASCTAWLTSSAAR